MTQTEPFTLFCKTNYKRIGSEITKPRVFKDDDCTFGARVRKTTTTKQQQQKTAGARSCCIPELLELKGLTKTGDEHNLNTNPSKRKFTDLKKKKKFSKRAIRACGTKSSCESVCVCVLGGGGGGAGRALTISNLALLSAVFRVTAPQGWQ